MRSGFHEFVRAPPCAAVVQAERRVDDGRCVRFRLPRLSLVDGRGLRGSVCRWSGSGSPCAWRQRTDVRPRAGARRCLGRGSTGPDIPDRVALLPFALSALEIFAHWSKELGDPDMSLEKGLALLQEAFRAALQWDNGAFLICAAMGPVAGAVCGATDGFWVGTIRSRRGLTLRAAIPFGRSWSEWRCREKERRQRYLRGDSRAAGR